MAGRIAGDTAYIANRLSWKGTAILGVALFAIFYWILPALIAYELSSVEGSKVLRPMLEAFVARRIHWVQWIGITLGLVCAFFAVRNYFASERLGRVGERNSSLLGRFLARFLD